MKGATRKRALAKRALAALPLAVALAALPMQLAWAAGDPLTAVNNLSTFIFALIGQTCISANYSPVGDGRSFYPLWNETQP